MASLRLAVCGAAGRMGGQVVQALHAEAGLETVGLIDPADIPAALVDQFAPGAVTGSDAGQVFDAAKPDVVVDFTTASAAERSIHAALDRGISPVVGTTGLSDQAIDQIWRKCREKKIGAFIAPNFALGAVMLMRLCEVAAPFFDHVEIVELHHDRKLDAPSGTALQTARMIVSARGRPATDVPTEKFTVQGVRGGDYQGVKIHSVRLPGLVAHQEVLFGGLGQTLSLRHDSTSRDSFMPGVMMAVRRVRSLDGLVVGLDKLMFESASG